MILSRRKVLAASAAALFLTRPSKASTEDTLVACRASLARLFPNSLGQARALGRICGADTQGAEALLDQICQETLDRRRLVGAPLEALRAAIGERIRVDYAHGRTRRIDGWVLSQTEIRIFAILAG
ncbi:MAG TPA: hypothetical protein VHM01_20750 [Alphaproteobacteria bacterium]|nr:hypothetical protein [Alphaproteobacteria bacterium]